MKDTLGNELVQFGGLVADTLTHNLQDEEATLYQMLIKIDIRYGFPNVEALLRIYLTLFIL